MLIYSKKQIRCIKHVIGRRLIGVAHRVGASPLLLNLASLQQGYRLHHNTKVNSWWNTLYSLVFEDRKTFDLTIATKLQKKLNDYFKCIYFLLSRAPLGQSHYLAPVALGFLIMRKIFLVGNLFLLMCPSQCWSQHTVFYSMCGTGLPSANGAHQAWWLQWLVQPPTTNQYIRTGPLGGIWTHNSEDWNLKPDHSASGIATKLQSDSLAALMIMSVFSILSWWICWNHSAQKWLCQWLTSLVMQIPTISS